VTALACDPALETRPDELLANLLDRSARYRMAALAAYSEARPYFERAIAMREQCLGPEAQQTGASLSGLGELLRLQGKFDEARPLFERALAIGEKLFGRDHDATASDIYNLAHLYLNQRNLADAKPLLERALAIRTAAHGETDPLAAACLNSL